MKYLSSIVIEVITTVLFFIFLRKDFTSTKSTKKHKKYVKSTKM